MLLFNENNSNIVSLTSSRDSQKKKKITDKTEAPTMNPLANASNTFAF